LKKRTLFLSFLWVAALLFAGTSYADPVKVGFVNTGKVLENAPQAQAARKKLEQEFAPRDGEITAKQRKLKALDEKLSRDGDVMSDDERRKLERERLTQQRELKRTRDAFTEDLNLRRNEEFAKLQRTVAKAIVGIAKENGYDLVLEAGVVFASDRVDLTDKVLERLRATYKPGDEKKK
jgi:outer membrane protein